MAIKKFGMMDVESLKRNFGIYLVNKFLQYSVEYKQYEKDLKNYHKKVDEMNTFSESSLEYFQMSEEIKEIEERFVSDCIMQYMTNVIKYENINQNDISLCMKHWYDENNEMYSVKREFKQKLYDYSEGYFLFNK